MRPRVVRTFLAMLVALACSGCAHSPSSASSATSFVPPPKEEGQTRSSQASANHVALSIEVTQRAEDKTQRFSAIVSVTVDSTNPVTLKTRGGSPYEFLVTSASGATVFDSLPVDAKASGQAATHAGTTSKVSSDGSSSGTYEFSLDDPGRYSLSARTFGPNVSVPPIQVTVP